MTEFNRVSGKDIAGDPYTTIKDVVVLFDNMDISLHTLRDLATFEEVAVALAAIKYKVLLQKNKDYGRNSIKQGDLVKVLARLGEKVERAKNLVGDPDQQITTLKNILTNLPDDANLGELLDTMSEIDSVLFPRAKVGNEGPEDTLLDASNYSDIALQLLLGVWNQPYSEEV